MTTSHRAFAPPKGVELIRVLKGWWSPGWFEVPPYRSHLTCRPRRSCPLCRILRRPKFHYLTCLSYGVGVDVREK